MTRPSQAPPGFESGFVAPTPVYGVPQADGSIAPARTVAEGAAAARARVDHIADLRSAPGWRRIGAGLIDLALGVGVAAGVGFATGIGMGAKAGATTGVSAATNAGVTTGTGAATKLDVPGILPLGILAAVALVAAFLIRIAVAASADGASPGRLVVGTRAVDRDGSTLTPGRIATREGYVALYVVLFPWWFELLATRLWSAAYLRASPGSVSNAPVPQDRSTDTLVARNADIDVVRERAARAAASRPSSATSAAATAWHAPAGPASSAAYTGASAASPSAPYGGAAPHASSHPPGVAPYGAPSAPPAPAPYAPPGSPGWTPPPSAPAAYAGPDAAYGQPNPAYGTPAAGPAPGAGTYPPGPPAGPYTGPIAGAAPQPAGPRLSAAPFIPAGPDPDVVAAQTALHDRHARGGMAVHSMDRPEMARRAIAATLDYVLIVGITGLVLSATPIGHDALTSAFHGHLVPKKAAGALPVALIVWFLLRPFAIAALGQTAGHFLMHYRVYGRNGARVGLGKAVLREVSAWGALFVYARMYGGREDWRTPSYMVNADLVEEDPLQPRLSHDRMADTWPIRI